MSVTMQSTVDRLDKPSAYYLGRVSAPASCSKLFGQTLIMSCATQNKKRKYGRDRDDDDVGRQRTPEEPEDPLKDATTLYVGNLYVKELSLNSQEVKSVADVIQIILHYRGTDT